jgi:hypothetical protein
MDNMYPPPGDDPQDQRPTEQFWAASSPPAGNQDPYGHGPGYQPQQSPGVREHFARDGRKALHWTVGITAAALLAGGGLIAGVTLAGSGPATPGPTGQAAALNATLSSADSPTVSSAPASAGLGSSLTATNSTAGSTAASAQRCAKEAAAVRAAGHPRAANVIAAHCRGLRLRIARLIGGIDGQFMFKTKTGFRTLAYERGVIETVNTGSSIVVQAADGTTWTWDLVSNTVVRENGAKTAETVLATGQAVWVGGPVNSGTKDARLIVIRPPASSSPASPSATPSAPSSAS